MIARLAIPFFFIMTLVVAPIVLALLCRWLAPRRYWRPLASVITLLIWSLVGYGYWVGFDQFEVNRITYASTDLPQSFDGYRIVQFSDAHVGTLTGSKRYLLQQAVDSMNAQHADAIVFTGDIINLHPDELRECLPILRQLRAKDGIYSILGNHDYPIYQDYDEAEKKQFRQQLIQMERDLGWQLLLNEHREIRRDSDSIVIAGMENWGTVKRMPREGNLRKTLEGVSDSSFVVMLQHDPTAWRTHILPECHAQLTLSGHTHGGQFELFGWSPASFTYDEWGGETFEKSRELMVSTGMGGLIPFRIGIPGEIVVITLKTKK